MNDFAEPGSLAPTGLFLGGTKYMVIQGEPGAVIRGKKVRTPCESTFFFSIFFLLLLAHFIQITCFFLFDILVSSSSLLVKQMWILNFVFTFLHNYNWQILLQRGLGNFLYIQFSVWVVVHLICWHYVFVVTFNMRL